eukprot:TRINITY_DN107063_c0_g1_i1.p1 TRINITY_DN107063_c0_g1~~TRINITY_DN107063_c0_g1_i1.p1  ORF type:complete len:333 (-),score=30.52 TRINITY_DN107063_c0_g1_i1:53-1051(-)
MVSFGNLLDCRLRGYLDAKVKFQPVDLLMIVEMSIAAAIAEIHLGLILPRLGLVSFAACPWAAHLTRAVVFVSAPVSYLLAYFVVCGSVHYTYTKLYPEEGRRLSIQSKPMTDIELQNAIVFSVKSIASVAGASSYAYYAIQGWTNIHWGRPQLRELPWFVLGYILVDISAYWVHRGLHRPWWYRHVHKAHHLWKSPNIFVTSALHPAEILALTVPTLSILTALPLSIFSVILLLAWIYVCNAIDHSGMRLENLPWSRLLFWQAPVDFHDNHHAYFHANYGAMVDWWDKLGGTFYHPKVHGDVGVGEHEFKTASELCKASAKGKHATDEGRT